MIDYKKLKISDTNRIKEQQIIDRIGQCIDDGFSWIFNAGAGSGKTYALVQSLKMLLDKKGPQFYIHGQKVFAKKFYRFSDYLGTTSQMSELLGISSISGILRFGRYPAYHGISEPHLAVKSSKTVVENRPYY